MPNQVGYSGLNALYKFGQFKFQQLLSFILKMEENFPKKWGNIKQEERIQEESQQEKVEEVEERQIEVNSVIPNSSASQKSKDTVKQNKQQGLEQKQKEQDQDFFSPIKQEKPLEEYPQKLHEQVLQKQSQYFQQAINAESRKEQLLPLNQHVSQKQESIVPEGYIYLRPSKMIRTGMFKNEFDLRFDALRNTLITKGIVSVLTTFLPQMRKFAKENPHIKSNPEKKDQEELQRQLKMVKPDFSVVTEKDIRYTWIGHSTAVIQIGPDNFIIDPVFSDRASPIQAVGPKRFRPPACSIHQLPPISTVLISHDHYDHLDENSLKTLHKCFEPLFVAGIGSQGVLPKKSNKLLMDWMDTTTVGINGRIYRITFVPVCHWSKRGIKDLNTRLWGGFVLQTPFNQKVFYSGDTGYCDVFKEIGRMFGPFDLSILPIGAYEPRIVLKPQHINPEEAVIIHKELRSRQSVGVHWGTFPLGAQGFYQAKVDLAEARKKHNIPDHEFITVFHGESAIFQKDQPYKK